MLRWVLLLVLAVLTTGCLEYGKDVRTDVTHLDDVDYAPNASDILVLFGVSEPSFAYQQIAFIEVTGNREATVDLLLKKLKRKAAGFGADAVIFVERDYITREEGTLFIADPDYYDAAVLSGVAVRYVPYAD